MIIRCDVNCWFPLQFKDLLISGQLSMWAQKTRGPGFLQHFCCGQNCVVQKKTKKKFLIFILLYFVSRTMLKITIHVKVGKQKMEINGNLQFVRLLSLCMFSLLTLTEPDAVENNEFAWCSVLHVGTFPNDVSSFLQDTVYCTSLTVTFFVFVLWEEPKQTL